jgi:hypothetical protein
MAYRYPIPPVAGARVRRCAVFLIGLLAIPESLASAQEYTGQALMREARTVLERHQWVSAKLHHQIDLYQQQLIGNGVYRQGPPKTHWMSLDLKLIVGNQTTIIQQRCDGDSRWQCRSVDDRRVSVTRVDLTRLQQSADDWDRDVWQAIDRGAPELGQGGLPKLLAALDKAFEFRAVAKEKTKLLRLPELPMYKIRGQWRADRQAKWLPGQKDAIASGLPVDLTKLPPPIPDHVLVFLGRDDLFPYRIEYGRDDPKAPERSRTLVAIDLDEVVFDVPIDSGEFTFDPGDAPVVDQTELYIQMLGSSPKPPKSAR